MDEPALHVILEGLDKRISGLEEILGDLRAERENLAGPNPSAGSRPSSSRGQNPDLPLIWLLEEECIRYVLFRSA